MQSSLIFLLIVFIALSLQGYYFGFFEKRGYGSLHFLRVNLYSLVPAITEIIPNSMRGMYQNRRD